MPHRLLSYVLKISSLTTLTAVVVGACGGDDSSTTTPAPPTPAATRQAATSVPAATPTAPAAATPPPVPTPTSLPATPTPTGPTPKYGGTMSMRTIRDFGADMDARSPIGQFSGITYLSMMNNLSVYDPADFNKVMPDLAERWSLSEDGKAWTFSLRGEVRWHDGAAFTSKDVAFTFDKYLNPETTPNTVQKVRFAAVAGVETPDGRTVRINLKTVSAAFETSIFHPSAVIYPAHNPLNEAKWKSNPVGTGPFTFSSRTPNVSVSMVRNAQYFKKDAGGRALPYLDKVEQFTIPDRGILLGAFSSGKLTCLCGFSSDVFVDEVDQVRRLVPTARIEILPSGGVRHLNFNSRAPLNDQKVRQAISIGIDRKDVNNVFHAGTGYYPPSYLMPLKQGGQWALPDDEVLKTPGYRDPKDQDVAQARQLFREAGFDPSTASLTLIADPKDSPALEALDAQLVKLGFKRSRIIALASVDRDAALGRGEFDLHVMEYPIGNDPSESLQTAALSNGSRNYGKWSFPQIDSQFQQQDGIVDPAKRRDTLWTLQRQLNDLSYQVPFLNEALAYAAHPYVEGYALRRTSNVSSVFRLEAVWFNR